MGLGTTPKPAKNTGLGVLRWPPVTSKCSLLTIRDELSSYIEISVCNTYISESRATYNCVAYDQSVKKNNIV